MSLGKLNLNKPISFYLLLVLLFLLPWQTRWLYAPASLSGGFWEYGSQSLYATELLLGLTLLVFIIERLADSRFRAWLRSSSRSGHAIKRLAWFGMVLLYLGFVAGSSSNPDIVKEKLLQLLLAVCLGLLVVTYSVYRERLMMALWFGAVVQGMLAVWQFLTQVIWHLPYSGIAPHLAKDLGAFVVEFGEERWLRAYGAFGSPNMLGGFLAATFILGLWLYLKTPPSLKKLLLMLGQLIILAGLVLSFSRAAWLATFIGILACISVLVRQHMWAEKKFEFGKMILYCLVVAGFLFVLYKPLFLTRVSGTGRLEAISNLTRRAEYAQWRDVMKKNLWLGTGPGLYTYAFHKIESNHPAWYYQPIHNTFALLIAEWGVVGLAVWGVVLWLMRAVFKKPLFWPVILTLGASLFLDHFWWSLWCGMLLLTVFLVSVQWPSLYHSQ